MAAEQGTPVRIAALGDLHYGKASQGTLQSIFVQIAAQADVLLLCGDLTDYGLPEEARGLAREIVAAVRIPILTVLGNHDFHSGKQEEITAILRDAGIIVLDGDSYEVHGIGFAGIKGFGGGFGPRALGPWGEDIFKRFVHEAVDEALKLEAALARLRTPTRITIVHYAPIVETVDGEPLEIYPFLGSSRLEEPINRYQVQAVVHGHAHRGRREGRTAAGVPVYNVSLPLLMRESPERPFLLMEIDAPEPAVQPAEPRPAAVPAASQVSN